MKVPGASLLRDERAQAFAELVIIAPLFIVCLGGHVRAHVKARADQEVLEAARMAAYRATGTRTFEDIDLTGLEQATGTLESKLKQFQEVKKILEDVSKKLDALADAIEEGIREGVRHATEAIVSFFTGTPAAPPAAAGLPPPPVETVAPETYEEDDLRPLAKQLLIERLRLVNHQEPPRRTRLAPLLGGAQESRPARYRLVKQDYGTEFFVVEDNDTYGYAHPVVRIWDQLARPPSNANPLGDLLMRRADDEDLARVQPCRPSYRIHSPYALGHDPNCSECRGSQAEATRP